MSLVKINPNIPNKILENQVQQHIDHSTVTYFRHAEIICISTYHINRMDGRNCIISVDAEKAFNKIQHPFIIKTLDKLGIERTSLT